MICAGRRGGKSETIARVATFEALHGGHAIALAPGQIGVFSVVAPLRSQSAELVRYAKGLAALPTCKKHCTGETAEQAIFGQCAVEITTSSDVALSGKTSFGGCFEEAAKLPGDDAAVSDRELRASFRPALAPVRGAPRRRFWMITSAFLDDGLAFETERDNFGKVGAPVLCFRGPTTLYNPAIDREWLDREKKRDPRSFEREFECQWTPAITEGWFPPDAIDRCFDAHREPSLTAIRGVEYSVGIDAAFRGDGFAIVVVHQEQRDDGSPPRTIVDYVHAWTAPPNGVLSSEETIANVARIAHGFGATVVHGDQKDADTLAEIAERHGIVLRKTDWTASNKGPLYRRVRDAMVDGLVSLPNDPKLIRELRGMRGRFLRSGVEQIEARSGKDDRVSALVLAFAHAGTVAANARMFSEVLESIPGIDAPTPNRMAGFMTPFQTEELPECFPEELPDAHPRSKFNAARRRAAALAHNLTDRPTHTPSPLSPHGRAGIL